MARGTTQAKKPAKKKLVTKRSSKPATTNRATTNPATTALAEVTLPAMKGPMFGVSGDGRFVAYAGAVQARVFAL